MKKSIIAILLISFLACNKKADLIVGKWNTSIFLNNEKLKEFVGDIPAGVEAEMYTDMNYEFFSTKTYNSEGSITVRFKSLGEEIPIIYSIKESGTWSFDNDMLIQTTKSSQVLAGNEFTKNLMRSEPDFTSSIVPKRGETIASKVINLSSTIMEIKSEDMNGYIITFRK